MQGGVHYNPGQRAVFISRQKKLECPTDITNEIMAAANALFIEHYNWQHPIEKPWYPRGKTGTGGYTSTA